MGVFAVPDHLTDESADCRTLLFQSHVVHTTAEDCQHLYQKIEFLRAQFLLFGGGLQFSDAVFHIGVAAGECFDTLGD